MDHFGEVTGGSEAARAAGSATEWVAEIVDRISVGEVVDLDALALEYPDRIEWVKQLKPVMTIMSRLRPAAAIDAPSLTNHELGEALGDFRTVRVIGRGGMGVVYEAVQISLNRRVALKILPASSADDPRRVRRFQVEAQAASLLNDPHIVPVYMVGSENGVHYYAMQLIEGLTLAQLMNQFRDAREFVAEPVTAALDFPWGGSGEGDTPSEPASKIGSHGGVPSWRISKTPARNLGLARASARLAAELGRQAALALDHAHEQGIVHRDIKPSNLLIENSGWLWVADFGLARIAGGGDQTSTGAVMGTLRYMSPEQVIGPRAVVDHRTDIYSLGTTLYELLTLRPAFESDDRLELIVKIAHDEPRRPRRIDPSIPRDLETIVLKAMAKGPAGRYASARELADDLGRFIEGRPITARPPSATDRAAKWVRRHRPVVVATALFLLAAAIGLGGAILWRDGVIRRHNSQLTAALVHVEQNALSTRRFLYDSRMNLAQQAWASGHVELAQELLEGLRPEPGGHDLRGFEWHYLRRICHVDVSLLAAHEALSMIISPDGRTLVSGGSDGSLVFWDLAAGRERLRFQGHAREVTGLLFSPDGRGLVTWASVGRVPGELKLWDPGTGRHFVSIPRITGQIADVAFSPDSRVLVILERSIDGNHFKHRVVFWNLDRGPDQPAPGAPPIVCDRMAYSPDGRWLATGKSSCNKVTLRDAATGQPIKTFSSRFPGTGGIGFSPDGRTLAVHSKGLTIWDTRSGQELCSLEDHVWVYHAFSADGNRLAGLTPEGKAIELIKDVKTRPRRVLIATKAGRHLRFAFSSDGTILAGGGVGLSATLWETSSGRKLAEFPDKTREVRCMTFAPGDQSLIFASQDGRMRSWHFDKRKEAAAELAGHQKEVWALAYTPDGSSLLSAGDDHVIKLWDARDGRPQATFKGHDALVTALAINSAGTLVASASFDKTVGLWALPGGKPGPLLRGHTDRVRAVAFSPDGKTLASGGSDKTVRLWNAETGEMISVITGHTDTVRAVAFDPGGSFLLSSSNDRTITVTALDERAKSFSLACAKPNSSLAFSPDGTILAAGDDWGNVSFWDVPNGSRRTAVKGSDATIWGLAFSPDGRTLAAACGDAKVRLWDPRTGQVVLVLNGHKERVNAVAFSPDGQTLASADHKGDVKLWQTAPRAGDAIFRETR